jgi:hypothetical protein
MILLLDKYPKGAVKKALIWIKIFVKEGVLLQDWKEVFRNRNKGGSVFIPQIIKKQLSEVTEIHHNLLSNQYYEKVVVVNDIECLKWAIEQKKMGKIGELIIGPFIQNHPHEYNSILLSSHVDKEIFFSEWHKNMFLFFEPKLKERKLYTWFCGVDDQFWKSANKNKKQKTVLIYCKTHTNEIAKPIIDFLEKKGFSIFIVKVSNYTWEEYKEKLSQSELAIFISVTETQGLAIFEAWSMNVPTYHWNSKQWRYQGLSYDLASSCPYLQPELGDEFENLIEFKSNFIKKYNELISKNPETIVAQKYTLEKSTQLLQNIIAE